MEYEDIVADDDSDKEARRTRPRSEWALYLQLHRVNPVRVPLSFTSNGAGHNSKH
jgi:hypothetical protein